MSDDDINTPRTKRGTRRKKEITPQEHERLKRIGIQKGTSGNPKGRPPMDEEVRELRRKYAPEANEVAYHLMMNSTNDMVRMKAVEFFHDPFVSKAAQKHEIGHTHTFDFDAVIAAWDQKKVAATSPPLIEAEAQEVPSVDQNGPAHADADAGDLKQAQPKSI